MKKRFPLILMAVLSLAFWGCGGGAGSVDPNDPTDPSTKKPGAPVGITSKDARGLFLSSSASGASGKVVGSARALSGSASTTLGLISSGGIIENAIFVDGEGTEIPVSVSAAKQMTDGYVLLTYSYDLGGTTETETATLNMATGALAAVDVVPSNWERIFSRGASAWYVSGGSIYRMTLATGAAVELSDSGDVYHWLGAWHEDSVPTGGTSNWNNDTWLYADLSGNAYAIYVQSSQFVMGQAITASGTKKEFGANWMVYSLSAYTGSGIAPIDRSINSVYIIQGHEVWDNQPGRVGTGTNPVGGFSMHLYKATFDPTTAGVLSFNLDVNPISWAMMPHGESPSIGAVKSGIFADQTIITIGADTFTVSNDVITLKDTSAVPVSHWSPLYGNMGVKVTNWKIFGGLLYYGPTQTTSTIGLVKLGGSVADVHQLLSDATISSWSVVGGVLFWTNASGSWKAPIDTIAGTLGTTEAWDGGTVVAVTQ